MFFTLIKSHRISKKGGNIFGMLKIVSQNFSFSVQWLIYGNKYSWCVYFTSINIVAGQSKAHSTTSKNHSQICHSWYIHSWAKSLSESCFQLELPSFGTKYTTQGLRVVIGSAWSGMAYVCQKGRYIFLKHSSVDNF